MRVTAAFSRLLDLPGVWVKKVRFEPDQVIVWNEAQNQIGYKLITPGATLVLITGIYMAADRWKDAGSFWFAAAVSVAGGTQP